MTDTRDLIPQLLAAEAKLGSGWPWGDLLSRTATRLAALAQHNEKLARSLMNECKYGINEIQRAEAAEARVRELEALKEVEINAANAWKQRAEAAEAECDQLRERIINKEVRVQELEMTVHDLRSND